MSASFRDILCVLLHVVCLKALPYSRGLAPTLPWTRPWSNIRKALPLQTSQESVVLAVSNFYVLCVFIFYLLRYFFVCNEFSSFVIFVVYILLLPLARAVSYSMAVRKCVYVTYLYMSSMHLLSTIFMCCTHEAYYLKYVR